MSANAIDGFVRGAAIDSPKCSALLSTSVLGKLHCCVLILGQCLQWAGHIGQIDIGWQDRRDAAKRSCGPIGI